jgi:hypothetical protein
VNPLEGIQPHTDLLPHGITQAASRSFESARAQSQTIGLPFRGGSIVSSQHIQPDSQARWQPPKIRAKAQERSGGMGDDYRRLIWARRKTAPYSLGEGYGAHTNRSHRIRQPQAFHGQKWRIFQIC